MNWLGVGVWAVLAAGFGLAEWNGLRKKHDRWPPLTEVIKDIMSSPWAPQWWIFLGLWAWLGVHFFLRGWSW